MPRNPEKLGRLNGAVAVCRWSVMIAIRKSSEVNSEDRESRDFVDKLVHLYS